jgi:hypothetical protein
MRLSETSALTQATTAMRSAPPAGRIVWDFSSEAGPILGVVFGCWASRRSVPTGPGGQVGPAVEFLRRRTGPALSIFLSTAMTWTGWFATPSLFARASEVVRARV